MSGYVHCKCRDCFEIAIASDDEEESGAFCWECEEAGCEPDSECQIERVWCPKCGAEYFGEPESGQFTCEDCGGGAT